MLENAYLREPDIDFPCSVMRGRQSAKEFRTQSFFSVPSFFLELSNPHRGVVCLRPELTKEVRRGGEKIGHAGEQER